MPRPTQVCVVRGLQRRCAPGPMKWERLMREERSDGASHRRRQALYCVCVCVCLYASAGETAALQHAVIRSPPKPPTILPPPCTLAAPALIPRHAHTGFPCLFTQYPEWVVYQTAASDGQRNCDLAACRVQGLWSWLRDEVSFLPWPLRIN